MLPVNGLYGHIQRNNALSLLLLAGFVVSFELLCLAFWLPGLSHVALVGWLTDMSGRSLQAVIVAGRGWLATLALTTLVPGLVWFCVSLAMHGRLVRKATAFAPLRREDERRLYTIVETTAIGFGLPMPALGVMEVAGRNAFSHGLGPGNATLVVTRGLLRALDDEELEAVVAHEMSHIRGRDTRLMAVVFVLCGMMTTFGRALIWRHGTTKWLALLLVPVVPVLAFLVANVLAMVLCIVVAAVLLAGLLRLAISRRRELVADAEAVAYTKNPRALIAALRKLDGQADIGDIEPHVRPMMIAGGHDGWFGTHPAPERRIEALHAYAGADREPVRARRDTRAGQDAERQRFGLKPAVSGDTGGGALRGVRLLLADLADPRKPGDDGAANANVVVLSIAVAITYGIVILGPALWRGGASHAAVSGPLACFGLDGHAPYHQGIAQFEPPQSHGDIADWHHRDPLRRMLHAKWKQEGEVARRMTQCERHACAGAEEAALDLELLHYVRERKRISRILDETYGAAGLRYLGQRYDTPFDQRVVARIRARFAVSGLGLDPNGPMAAEIRLLTERGSEAFVPCRGPGFAPVWSGAVPARASGESFGRR